MTLRFIVSSTCLVAASAAPVWGQTPPGAATSARPAAIARFEEVTLERTSCRGRCPSYTVRIHGDGTVDYQGGADVKTTGAAQGHLSTAEVKALVDAINNAGYFGLQDSYEKGEGGCPTYWTDLPSAITSVRAGGRTKSITHNLGCREQDVGASFGPVFPARLEQFENRIDEIAGTTRWVR
jgi:hypothetical protein